MHALAHARWLLHHLPDLDAVIERLIGALKPGGLLLIEEPDLYPVTAGHAGAPPLYARVMDASCAARSPAPGAIATGRAALPAMIASHHLHDAQAAAEVAVLRGGGSLARFYRLSAQQARARVLAGGYVSAEEYDAASDLLDDPALWAFAACTVSAWGWRKAA